MAEFDVFASEKKRGFFGKIWHRGKWVIIFFVVLVFLGLLGYFFIQRMANQSQSSQEAATAQPEKTLTPQTSDVPAAQDTPFSGGSAANYQSEHFRVGDIAVGGEAEFLLTEDTPDLLAISSIRGESFTEKDKPEVKLVLSFKTNKLAKSTITYSKGAGQVEKKVDEEDYSLDHSLIISGLDQASTYIYTIVSTDRFGNTATSDPHAVYTGSKTASLFDLISGAIGDVFGWAINRK